MKNTKRNLKVLLSILMLAAIIVVTEPAVWAASTKGTEKSASSVCTTCKGNGICTNCNGFMREFKRKGDTLEAIECSVCKGTGKCVVCNASGKTESSKSSASKKPTSSKKPSSSKEPSSSKKPSSNKKLASSKKPGSSKKPSSSKKSSSSKSKSKKTKNSNNISSKVQYKVISKNFSNSGDTLIVAGNISNTSDTYDLVALKKGTFYLKDKNGKVIFEVPLNKGLANKIAHNCSIGYCQLVPLDSKLYKAEDVTPYIEAAWDYKKCEGKNCSYCKEFEKAQADKEAGTNFDSEIDWSIYYDTEDYGTDSNESQTGVKCHICKGTGKCPDCEGTGTIKIKKNGINLGKNGSNTSYNQTIQCPGCGGEKKCPRCSGKKVLQ